MVKDKSAVTEWMLCGNGDSELAARTRNVPCGYVTKDRYKIFFEVGGRGKSYIDYEDFWRVVSLTSRVVDWTFPNCSCSIWLHGTLTEEALRKSKIYQITYTYQPTKGTSGGGSGNNTFTTK